MQCLVLWDAESAGVENAALENTGLKRGNKNMKSVKWLN